MTGRDPSVSGEPRRADLPTAELSAAELEAAGLHDVGSKHEGNDGERLTPEELGAESASALPVKEAMSTITTDLSGIDNFAMPINEAIAINNQTVGSVAIADADQIVILEQTDFDPDPDGAATDMPDATDSQPDEQPHGFRGGHR